MLGWVLVVADELSFVFRRSFGNFVGFFGADGGVVALVELASFLLYTARILREAKVRLKRNRSDTDVSPKWSRSETEREIDMQSK